MRLLVLLFLSGGCDYLNSKTKIQYMPDMADAPTMKAQENYIDPPEGAVAMNAALYPTDVETSEKVLTNPVQPSSEVLQQGKHLFGIYCAVCHGDKADGQNHFNGKFPAPPDLNTDFYKQKKDGFYFHRITFGAAIMPSYADKTTVMERWMIVAYLRTLQGVGSHE